MHIIAKHLQQTILTFFTNYIVVKPLDVFCFENCSFSTCNLITYKLTTFLCYEITRKLFILST